MAANPSIRGVVIPDGWRLVPIEPTAQMLAAAVMSAVYNDASEADKLAAGAVLELLPQTGHPDARTVIAEIARDYRAAVSASPPSPPAVWSGEDISAISQSGYDAPMGASAGAEPSGLWRKKFLVKASQWWKPGDHPAVVMKSASNRYADEPIPWIETLEGGHIVSPGDWIITGIQGEHHPCKPDIFAATYEAVEPAPAPDAEATREWLRRRNEALRTSPARSTDVSDEGPGITSVNSPSPLPRLGDGG